MRKNVGKPGGFDFSGDEEVPLCLHPFSEDVKGIGNCSGVNKLS